MKKLLIIILLYLNVFAFAQTTKLDQEFVNPPQSAKPQTWWHWMNGNISKEGITADLEAMQSVGIGGAQAFEVSNSIPAGNVKYMSPQWREMMKHAINESNRLGLDFCFHNTPGWSSSGGKWITPEYSMQKVIYSEKQIVGPATYNGDIEQPKTDENAKRDDENVNTNVSEYYKDIVVLAFPTPQGEINGKAYRIKDWKIKGGFDNGVLAAEKIVNIDTKNVIRKNQIIDITNKKSWKVPAGNWTIIRFGHTSTNVTNRQSPASVLGLECDKLSRRGAQLHWENTVGKVIADAGSLAGKTLNNILIDSYEVGSQNWTLDFAAQFKKQNKYDIFKYLPCLTGRVIESTQVSERFLWDFRRTIANLYNEEYVGAFAEMCHQYNIKLSIEPFGGGNFIHLEVGAKSDIPMGEFWNGQAERYAWTNKLAASAANIAGNTIVGAEAFTSSPSNAWKNYPAMLKKQGDWAFSQGINRYIFHTYAHQPWTNIKPGMTMGPHGMMGNRNNTWWEQGKEWMTYISRSQYLLQQGKPVKDICYLISEDAPYNNSLKKWSEFATEPPKGYDFDYIDASSLMKMKVVNNQLLIPDAMTYKVLVISESIGMRVELAKKINELVSNGAVIIGYKPTYSPSLRNYPNNDNKVKSLCSGISNKSLIEVLNDKEIQPDIKINNNNIEYIHRKTDDVDIYYLTNQSKENINIDIDFRVNGKEPEIWCPKSGTIKKVPFYTFVDNYTKVKLNFDTEESYFLIFRNQTSINGLQSITKDNVEVNPKLIENNNNEYTIFTDKTGEYTLTDNNNKKLSAKVNTIPQAIEIENNWILKFPKEMVDKTSIVQNKLKSLTEYENYDIKHFSGTTSYTNEFTISNEINAANYKIVLDLGKVEVIAEVILNNKNIGILWHEPFQIDITKYIISGTNKLEIKVTNLWINRLIGDAKFDDDAKFTTAGSRGKGIKEIPEWLLTNQPKPKSERKIFSTWQFYDSKSDLFPSGLIGPVKIKFLKKTKFANNSQLTNN